MTLTTTFAKPQNFVAAQRIIPAPPHYHLTELSQELFQLMPQLLGPRTQEESWVAYLKQGQLCHLDPIARGDLSFNPLATFAIHQRALCYQADGFYLFHNHPGGRPLHSFEDQGVTQRLMQIDDCLKCNFRGHLVVTREGCFFDTGQMVADSPYLVTAATPIGRCLNYQFDETLQPIFSAYGPLLSAEAITQWVRFAVTCHGDRFNTPESRRVICYFNYDLTPAAWLPIQGDLTNEAVQRAIWTGALLTNTQLLVQIIFAAPNLATPQLTQPFQAAIQEPVDWLAPLELQLIDTIVLSEDRAAGTITHLARSECYLLS